MNGKLDVEIVTQHGVVYRGAADGLVAPGSAGYFGVLPRHAPMIADLGVGELRVRHGDQWERYALSGGVFHIRDGRAVVMADAVERVRDIDVGRAQDAANRARDRLQRGRGVADVDPLRAELALARALNRLRLAGPASIDS
jgi:F-type H+-transporting ATPase subunit epsilon